MDTRLLLVFAMLPAAVRAAEPPIPAKPPAPPGLTFVLPTLPRPEAPKITIVPPGIPPGSLYRLAPSTPMIAIEPAPSPPARLLVFREADRAVTKTFHPLMTPDVQVEIITMKKTGYYP